MNERDQNNLNFILSLDKEGLDKWIQQLDGSDVYYARTLLAKARDQVNTAAMKALDEAVELSDLNEARDIISRIKAKM